ncbi:MAG: hypothetical protein KGH61_00635 [Candidatus Micrarchaeota archaeon]|nr:hypothetical protein [Candidatus Micrarchaeota archaeon]MDE1847442.1 hypothetical protein [Candidatus Micrarchaeota archaeon]MDE1864063.1 hypothetical protein [Candidatus Micrarchaeota archaeon]
MPRPRISNDKLQSPFGTIRRNEAQERYLRASEFAVRPENERAIPSLLAFAQTIVPTDRKLVQMLETLVPEWKRDKEVFQSEPELTERIFALFRPTVNSYALEQLAARHEEHLGKMVAFSQIIGAQKEKKVLEGILKKTFKARE